MIIGQTEWSGNLGAANFVCSEEQILDGGLGAKIIPQGQFVASHRLDEEQRKVLCAIGGANWLLLRLMSEIPFHNFETSESLLANRFFKRRSVRPEDPGCPANRLHTVHPNLKILNRIGKKLATELWVLVE
jgi:hypothetical protein